MNANRWHDQKRDFFIAGAHDAIENGYNTAIAYYEHGKQQLLKQIGIEKEELAKEFITKIQNGIAQELENEKWDEEIKQYMQKIQQIFANYVDTGSAEFQELVTKCEEQVQKNSQNRRDYYRRLVDDLEATLNSQGLQKSVLQQLAGLNNMTDKQFSYYYGYLRQLLLSVASIGKNNYNFTIKENDYRKSIKGEMKEQMVAEAMSKVMRQYGARAEQTGASKNKQNQEIKQDVILFSSNQRVLRSTNDPFKNIINRMQSIAGNTEVAIVDKWAFGLQSKSWSFPPDDVLFTPGAWLNMPFGGFAEGKPQDDDAHYWHAGVWNVMENITKVIGEGTILYSLGGDQVMWTSDLLSKLREKQLVLAYYWNKSQEKIVSSEVAAYYHQDNI